VAGLVAFLVIAVAVARLLPIVLRALRSEHDLFLMVSVASGLALAGVGSAAFGVPLALAAFVGGLAVTESPEAAEARRRLLPFRDLFAVLFFVAIGTLIEPASVVRGFGWLVLFLALIVVAKITVAYGLARIARLSARPSQLAIGLGQIGEFSFVLGSAAVAAGAIAHETYVALIAAVALSIAVSSVVVRLVGRSTPPQPAVAT
jgi:CPA2 family monovalent cation:H+ antiporter-2